MEIHAAHLRPGYVLRNDRRGLLEVASVEVEQREAATYNFDVEGWHTYFVAEREGAPAVWVHNASLDAQGFFAKRHEYAGGNPAAPRQTRVKIPLQGSRGRDFTQANKAAEFSKTPAVGRHEMTAALIARRVGSSKISISPLNHLPPGTEDSHSLNPRTSFGGPGIRLESPAAGPI